MTAMHNNDDTIGTSSKAREQALIAMLEGNMLPGIEFLGGTAALDEAVAENTLVFYRVSRGAAETGRRGGASAALDLMGRASTVRGAVLLTFDGWADDSRELFQIPIIRDFCFGLLFGISANPVVGRAHAKQVLPILLDEADRAFNDGRLVNDTFLQASGALWLVAHVFPQRVFSWQDGELMRDIGENIGLLQGLLDA